MSSSNEEWFAYECYQGCEVVIDLRAQADDPLIVHCPKCGQRCEFKGRKQADADGYGSRADVHNPDIQSGPHLGEVRRWIQRFARNGETVTWGSNTFLEMRPVTAGDMDRLAQDIADACGRDEDAHREREDRLRKKNLYAEAECDHLRAQLKKFGNHLPSCNGRDIDEDGRGTGPKGRDCDCGYPAALRPTVLSARPEESKGQG